MVTGEYPPAFFEHYRRPVASLSLQEAADRLGVHYMTAYRYVRHGRLTARKEGKSWVVEEEDLVTFEQQDPPQRGEAPWAERLEARMLAGDVAGASGVVNDAMASGVDPGEVYTDMIMPAMRRIGDRWAAGEVDVYEEHRASAVVQRLVGQLGTRFARRGRSKGTVLMCSPPGEKHWLGAMMVADLIRGAGYAVVDLGPDMPLDSLRHAVESATDLIAVAVGCSVTGRDADIEATTAAVRQVSSVPIVLGGHGIKDATHAQKLGGDGYVAPGDDPVAVIQDLVA